MKAGQENSAKGAEYESQGQARKRVAPGTSSRVMPTVGLYGRFPPRSAAPMLDLKGVAFGMVFNDKNELLVIARDRVIKYSVQAP